MSPICTAPPCTPTTATPRKPWLATSLLLASMGLAACAGMPPPTEQMALSSAAVAHATSAGAAEHAPADLRTANDKLALARAAMAAENHERALELAEQVQADARLAEVKTRSAKAQKTAREMGEGNRVLREELERVAK